MGQEGSRPVEYTVVICLCHSIGGRIPVGQQIGVMEVCVTAVVCGVAAGPTVPPDWLPGAAAAAGPPATGEEHA